MLDHTGLSLAVRYRPRSFAEVVGQKHATDVLAASIARGSLPPQLLFSGGSGLGKTTLARVAAAALLCEGREETSGDACGSCASCIDALTPGRNHPDVIEFDAASHGGKDEIRDIAARTHVAPLRGSHKIYIIDEAHGLSGPGGQAFLKTLEEPPPHVVFMLCTTDPQKMLKTNRGRCVELELLPPSRRVLLENLRRICAAESWLVPDDVLEAVLDSSDPDLGVRGTVSTLAKLGFLYEEGNSPSEGLVASVLGAAPPAGMRRLVSAVESCDRLAALKELASLRTVTSDSAIRAGLRRWSVDGVTRAIGSAEAHDLEAALWRLDQVVSAPPSREWLDVLVARLAAPEVSGEASALVAPVNAAMKELRALLDESRESKSSPVSSTAGAQANPSAAVAQVLTAAAPAPAGLSEVLGMCEVSLDDSSLTVLVPSEFASRISPFGPTLKTAAARLGVALRLRSKRAS